MIIEVLLYEPLGVGLGPTFTITTDIPGFTQEATLGELTSGIQITISDSATLVFITSIGECEGATLVLEIYPATSTTTSSSTTTTTTTIDCTIEGVAQLFTTTTTTTTIQCFIDVELLPSLSCELLGLSFTSFENNLIGLLTVGDLFTYPQYIITDFLVGWHLNAPEGIIVFYSGVGTDPLIQTIHPFTDEPVPPGDLYPVLLYIYINGIRYTTIVDDPLGGIYSEGILTCLPDVNTNFITVDNVNCETGTLIEQDYSHLFSYNNTLDPAINANRIIYFYLEDGLDFIAYKFVGYTVADEIKISYVSVLDPLNPTVCSWWIVGTNAVSDFISTPKVLGSNQSFGQLQQVINLRDFYEFNNGDYLLIEIIPRVYEPENINTNWNLYLKCLETFEDAVPPENSRVLDTESVVMTYDDIYCRYILHYSLIDNYAVSHFYKYLQYRYVALSYNQVYKNIGINDYITLFYFSTSTQFAIIEYNGFNCINSGSINYKKEGSVMTITFDSLIDYNSQKSIYNATLLNADWTNYTTDESNINHYKFWYLRIYNGTVCGDTYTEIFSYMHYDTIFTWNDINKQVIINISNVVNGYVSGICDTVSTSIDNMSTVIDDFINSADFDITTSEIQNESIIYSFYTLPVTNNYLTSDNTTGMFTQYTTTPAFCEMFTPTGWEYYNSGTGAGDVFGYITGDRSITITDENDPINNFKIENYQDTSTGERLVDSVLEYKIEDGIVIYPTTTTTTTIP